jgi:chlorobactene glucosyltransferase
MLYYILFFILNLSLFAWILFFIITVSKHKHIPTLSKKSPGKTLTFQPLLSVIIPSRNEASKIGNCMKHLKEQTYPNLEFIIVDDSDDDTVQVIKNIIKDDKRFKIFKQEKIPPGWVGKPHALQQGSKLAKGDWLVFIDADTVHEPELIEKALEYAIDNNLDMLSMLTHYICKTFWEKIIQPIPLDLIIFYFPIAKVSDPQSKVALANGPFIVIKNSVFKNVRGYETIKGYIADDIEMGKLVKGSGYKIGLINAQTLIKVRMYENLKEIWNGWSKNIFMGRVQRKKAQSKKLYQLLMIIGGAFGMFCIFTLPFLTMLVTLVLTTYTNQPQWIFYLLLFSSIIWIFSSVSQYIVCKLYYIGDPKYAPLIFLGSIVFIGIFINSGIKTITGKGTIWKGRRYSTDVKK